MSKELEKEIKALEELEKVIEEITIGNVDLRNTLKTSVLIATIKQALQRLEAIENANYSEALECLESIINDEKMHDYILYNCLDEDFINVRNSLLKAQEQDFNYNKIIIPFFNELAKILVINDIDEMLDKIKERKKGC